MAIEEVTVSGIWVKRRIPAPHDDRWLLVHDGHRVIRLVGPTVHATVRPGRTVLLGTRKELLEMIRRLNLTHATD